MNTWFKPFTIETLDQWVPGTMVEHLGIVFTEIGADFLRATMPVDHRTVQAMGILHGGASVALAETLGSVAGNMCLDLEKHVCVGQEINANHLRPASAGVVTGTARPVHLGQRTQVWQIEIRDARERLVCVSRITLAVIDRDPRVTLPGRSGAA
jgi:1,4-dihydroxy-2-naphthoyl-CoA hydrolase